MGPAATYALNPVMPDVSAHGAATPAAIRVEIATPERFTGIAEAWQDLVRRAAAANVFQHPAVIAAAARHGRRPIAIVLAWSGTRLDGVWAFARGRPDSGLPLAVLRAPIHRMAMLATPVVDARRAEATLAAMITAIAAAPDMPSLAEIDLLDAEGPVFTALDRALAALGRSPVVIRRLRRPQLDLRAADAPLAHATATRKKLRQRRRRLEQQGPLSARMHGEGEAAAAFAEFLALEASGWKGRRGTALEVNPDDAAFIRDSVAGLAAAGDAAVMALRLGDVPLAMQVLMRSGPTAFTWKTAYDERFASVSPGMLLLEDLTATLTGEPTLALADSCCNDDTTYMASAWLGRRELVRLMVDFRGTAPRRLHATAAAERAYLAARGAVRDLYWRAHRAWHAAVPRHG